MIIDLPQTAELRAKIQKLSSNVSEDRSAEKSILSQARREASTLDEILSAAATVATSTSTTASPGGGIRFGTDGTSRIADSSFSANSSGGSDRGDTNNFGSGTVGLDFPQPPSVSTSKKSTISQGGVLNQEHSHSGFWMEEDRATALRRVKELFAALETVGKNTSEFTTGFADGGASNSTGANKNDFIFSGRHVGDDECRSKRLCKHEGVVSGGAGGGATAMGGVFAVPTSTMVPAGREGTVVPGRVTGQEVLVRPNNNSQMQVTLSVIKVIPE